MINITTKISSFFNSEKTEKLTELLESVADAVSPIQKHGFGVLTSSYAVGKIIAAVSYYYTFYSDEFWRQSRWERIPFDLSLHSTIANILEESTYAHTYIHVLNDNARIKLYTIKSFQVGWTETTAGSRTGKIYVTRDKKNEFEQVIKEEIWSKYNTNNILISSSKKVSLDDETESSSIRFQIDDYISALPSATAERYSEYFKKAFTAGHNRSLMLYGPPGTGKSTIARAIITSLKLRCVRFRMSDIESFCNSLLYDVIDLFKPDAVVFDDFDRNMSSDMLEAMEYLKQNVKLVVATANNRNAIDEALLRPGRFDELEYVTHLDETVIKKILNEYQDAYETVKDWPIVFIQEYVTRRTFQTKQEVEDSMIELAERVKRIYELEERNNDIESILSSNRQETKNGLRGTMMLPVST